MMEVDCQETVPSTPCTPQRLQRQFDPTQPSTSSSGMATPMSAMSTPRMMTNCSNTSTPLVFNTTNYENEVATPSNNTYYNPATPTRPQGAMNSATPIGKLNNYPTTPGRSTSRLSSQGPIQSSPFRQQPLNMIPGPHERVHRLREAAVAKQNYMQQWMGTGYPAAPSPQQPNRPPSMIGSTMSSMSHMSELSRFSIGGMSTLSVNTEIANYSWPQNTHQAPHILSKVPQGSTVENQDPRMRRRMTFNELICSLKSNDTMKQMLALRELIPVAEQNQLEMSLQKPELKALIYSLFEILIPRENEDEKVVETTLYILYHAVLYPSKTRTCLKIFETLNLEIMGRDRREKSTDIGGPFTIEFKFNNSIGIFYIIMYRADQIESRYVTKAWMLLTHLLCNTFFKRKFFMEKYARNEDHEIRASVIGFAVESLKKDLKSKPKGFAVSVIRNLSSASNQIMALAMQSRVIEIFLNIMKEETIHEDLLWSTTQALSAFFSTASVNGEAFIRMGGVQVICGLLSHGSSRLLHELLLCMTRIADLPAIKEQNMSDPIHNIVQLLGSFDPTIVERSTAILMNIGLPNKKNKAILLQNGVTNHVFAVLRMSDQYSQLATNPQHSEVIRQQISNIYENCLMILNNVTLMSESNRLTSIEACKMISMNSDSASALLNFICIGTRYCRKLAITILKRIIETVPAYSERFVDLYATTNEQLPLLLLKRIWESMQQCRALNREILENKMNGKEDVERQRKDHEEIVKRSSDLLATLCLQSNHRFMDEVKKAMLNAGANPFLFLSHEISDTVLSYWLTFIWKVCSTPETLKCRLLLTLWTKANLHQNQFMPELYQLRTSAEIRKLIENLGNLARDQQINFSG